MREGVFCLAIFAHNEEGSIVRMLESVLRQSVWEQFPSERRQVLVYANGCTDRTAERVRDWAKDHPEVGVFETAERGKSQAWNAVQAHLRPDADFWFFADADVILHWRAVEYLLDLAEEHPSADVLSSNTVSSARFVPVAHRGFLESARAESERLKDAGRMVSARFYAMRRSLAASIELPPGLLNEDLFLTRMLGSERIRRSPKAIVIGREPTSVGDIVRYQVRTRIGSFQARRVSGPPIDSNKSLDRMKTRTWSYRQLSWKALVGKLLWMPLKLWVEWKASRVSPEGLDESFWMKVSSAKLGGGDEGRSERSPGRHVWLAKGAAEALRQPEALLERSDVRWVKDHLRTAVAAVVIDGEELYVKRFKPYAWYRSVESMLLGSAAARCRKIARLLEESGFRVPRILSVVETQRRGLPSDAYLVTEAVAGAEPGGQWWLAGWEGWSLAQRRDVLEGAARYLRRLHDAGLYTRDANTDNFLIRANAGASSPMADAEIFVLDLENFRQLRSVSRRRRIKNLVQVYRPVRGCTRLTERICFLRAYLGDGAESLRDWMPLLVETAREKDLKYRERQRRAQTP